MKRYIVGKSRESSLLTVNALGKLVIAKETETNVYLSTIDDVNGVIHIDLMPIFYVSINKAGDKFFLKNKLNKKIFTSRPLENDLKETAFLDNRLAAADWEYFDLTSVEERNEFDRTFNLMEKLYQNESINLFWWRAKGFINFGDEINPHIVEFLTKKEVVRVAPKETDLLGVGSILHFAEERNRKYKVWGTGTLAPMNLVENRFSPSLLRGPLTHSLMKDALPVLPYGDPGLICSRIWKASSQKKYKWGLLVHHKQVGKDWVKKLEANTKDIILIDVKNKNLEQLMLSISSCEFIASTSLHGLIVADSYQIPNIWLWDGALHIGGQWKFFDYFSGAGRSYIDNLNPNAINSLDDVVLKGGDFKYHLETESTIERIISSFPL